MSADVRTEHLIGFFHRGEGGGYLYVRYNEAGQPLLGSFSLGEITELAEMAGACWPADRRVKVQYVIGLSDDGETWTDVWSALAADGDMDGNPGPGRATEEFAVVTLEGFLAAGAGPARLTRRTTVTADEVIQPEPAAGGLASSGSGHDGPHDGHQQQDQG